MKVLGISAYFHDAAAALVVDGKIVAAAQEERFSRTKHDASLPLSAVRFCLEEGGLEMSDIDEVVFYEKPLRKFERLLVTHLREFPRGLGQWTRAMGTWLSKRLWQKGEICKELGCRPTQLSFCEHHLSHAASAFLCSPFEKAAVLTVDGVGEWATTSLFLGESTEAGSRLELVKELHFPHSIGLVYSALTAYLGFEVNEGEYKVMGLASYGEPRFLGDLEAICQIGEDGSLAVDPRYFCYHWHKERSFTKAFEDLLGPARRPGSALHLPATSEEDQRYADVAASIQALTERYLLLLARDAKAVTGAENLCLAGGVALNCVANRRIVEEGPFSGVFVQPAAGDAGGALGAALWATHVVGQRPRGPALEHAYLGAAYSPKEVETFLSDCQVPFQRFNDDDVYAAVAGRLAEGGVGGWFRGRFEWGPRALGARSILADPRDPKVRDHVNRKIKFREEFRPFAPCVMAEELDRWFDPPKGKVDYLSPFMCSIFRATEEARRRIPSVVHVDGTARAQRVDRRSAGDLHELLAAFRERTGVGVLLNTSLNLKDEPICSSPAEAYGLFMRSDLDFLVLENCIIDRKECHVAN